MRSPLRTSILALQSSLHPFTSNNGYPNIHSYRWATLEAGIERIMTRLRDGIDMKTYMELYTAVHNFCASQKGLPHSASISSNQSQRGGNLPLPTNLQYRSENLLRIPLNRKYVDTGFGAPGSCTRRPDIPCP